LNYEDANGTTANMKQPRNKRFDYLCCLHNNACQASKDTGTVVQVQCSVMMSNDLINGVGKGMMNNDLINGVGKGIGGLLLAAVGEEYVDSVSEDYEDEFAFNSSASRSGLSATIEASNDDGNATGLDSINASNSLAEPPSLDNSALEESHCNGGGKPSLDGDIVGPVAKLLFSHLDLLLPVEEDGLDLSFEDSNHISGTDIDNSGVEKESNLTSSFTSGAPADFKRDASTNETKGDTFSDSFEQQNQKAAGAALMLAQTGFNDAHNSGRDASGIGCNGDVECPIEQKAEASATCTACTALALVPTDSTSVVFAESKPCAPTKNLAPSENDLNQLEDSRKEARLDSSTISTDRANPCSAIGQPSKHLSRIREKAMKLKATRKGSRYNGSYSRAAAKPTTSSISPTKPAAETGIGLNVADEISPAKTVDVTDDASISIGVESTPTASQNLLI
jgi:hypothetical protein